MRNFFVGVIAFLMVFGQAQTASSQTRILRIATYNIEADVGVTAPLPGLIAPPGNTSDTQAGGVLEGIGEEIVGHDPAQPLDILALEETTSNPTTVTPIVNGLNAFYAYHNIAAIYTNSAYQAMQFGGSSNTGSGNGPNALVFNTQTVQLLASVPVDPVGGIVNLGTNSGEYREVMRYEFAPAGIAATPTNEFYIYVSHYKASSGSANAAKRLGEAQIIRTNEAIDLPATARVLYVGDYNVDDSGEAGCQTILSATAPNGVQQGQGIDPLNPTNNLNIDWSDDTADTNILIMLTEHSYELEYRDDLQVMTTNVYYGTGSGFKYIPGTYHAFGNNGTTAYYGSVNSGSDTALTNLMASAAISAAQLFLDLTNASDHLPVVADYTVPIPAPVFTGFNLAGTNLVFTVGNAATNGTYVVLMTTNLSLPLANWTMLTTNISTDSTFSFVLTNAVNQIVPQMFYQLQEK
jgi:hypothetical protein